MKRDRFTSNTRRLASMLLAAGLGFSGSVAAQAARGTSTAGGDGHPAADTARATEGGARRDTAGPVSASPLSTGSVDPITEAARDYVRTGVARIVEEGASVTFPYGHGQPTLTCAPLRACIIELESGESVLSRIAGDTQRWEIELAPAGPDGRTPLVVVKPHDCGLTTNLVLTTTAGRIYDLTLDSPPCLRGGVNPHGTYIRHVRFYYPDATVQAWPTASIETTAAPNRMSQGTRADAFNFDYRLRREHRFPWAPIAVFDDGIHCYIKLPPQAAHREAPVLFALADDGSKVLLNYSLTHDTFVTDRLFRRAVLMIGETDAQRVLQIENLRFDAPDAQDNGGAAHGDTPGPVLTP
jgi:type IV secretion system protein TrbG